MAVTFNSDFPEGSLHLWFCNRIWTIHIYNLEGFLYWNICLFYGFEKHKYGLLFLGSCCCSSSSQFSNELRVGDRPTAVKVKFGKHILHFICIYFESKTCQSRMELIFAKLSGSIPIKLFEVSNKGDGVIVNEAYKPFKSNSIVLVDRVNSLKSVPHNL